MSMNEKAEHATKPSSLDEIGIQALIERWAEPFAKRTGRGPARTTTRDLDVRCAASSLVARAGCLHGDLGNAFVVVREASGLDFHDVEITAGKDVAFATATGRCAGVDPNGKRERLQFRLTMGLRKIDGSGASSMSTIRCRRSSCRNRCSPQMTTAIGDELFRDSICAAMLLIEFGS